MDPTPSRAVRTAYIALTILFWLTVVGGLLVVSHRMFGLLQDASRLSIPAGLALDVPLPETVERAGPLPVTVDLLRPTPAQRLLAAAPAFVWWALTLGIVWLVRGIARTATHGDPFRSANVVRLRWLGVLFLLGYPLAVIADRAFTDRLFASGVDTGGPLPGEIVTDLPLVSGPAIVAGLSMLALSEIFAYGARLRADVDATI
jgi:hypothetical protein